MATKDYAPRTAEGTAEGAQQRAGGAKATPGPEVTPTKGGAAE